MRMKRLALSGLGIMAFVAFATTPLLSQAPSAPQLPPLRPTPALPGSPGTNASTPASTPVPDNSQPEPSAIYGYVTVVDPSTGQKYIGDPNGTPSSRGSGLTFPIHVVFRRTTDVSRTFTRDWPQGTAYYGGNPPRAVWYHIGMTQDPAAGDYPTVNYRDVTIHYDPARWRFLRVEMDPVGWQELSADGGHNNNVEVPVSQVPIIAEFPDFHGSVEGPR